MRARLDHSGFRRALRAEMDSMRTRIIGQQLIELASVDSTNMCAAELLALKEIGHGAVILAHEQTDGRGQRGRIWRSGAGLDITTSVVLLPQHLPANEQFVLAKIAALAVHDVVAEAMRMAVGGEPVRIKWPNDILVDRRKVAGILIANELVAGMVVSSVLGIGINVNSSELDAEFNATSLRMETGLVHDRLALLEGLCQRLEHYLDLWESGDRQFHSRYTDLLWSRGRYADLELDGQPFSARPVDVDAHGRLLVEDEAGHVQAFALERLRFANR